MDSFTDRVASYPTTESGLDPQWRKKNMLSLNAQK